MRTSFGPNVVPDEQPVVLPPKVTSAFTVCSPDVTSLENVNPVSYSPSLRFEEVKVHITFPAEWFAALLMVAFPLKEPEMESPHDIDSPPPIESE